MTLPTRHHSAISLVPSVPVISCTALVECRLLSLYGYWYFDFQHFLDRLMTSSIDDSDDVMQAIVIDLEKIMQEAA
jgi:hypothetical protein